MTTFFLGGVAGSGLSALLYASHGWAGICLLGAAFPAAALAVWTVEGVRGRRVVSAPAPATAG